MRLCGWCGVFKTIAIAPPRPPPIVAFALINQFTYQYIPPQAKFIWFWQRHEALWSPSVFGSAPIEERPS
jgi:hypothetical protein